MAKKNFDLNPIDPFKANAEQAPIASANAEQAKEPEQNKKQACYRLNLSLPIEQKYYLAEIAWRNKTSITAYIAGLIAEDMKQHPEWLETYDPTIK